MRKERLAGHKIPKSPASIKNQFDMDFAEEELRERVEAPRVSLTGRKKDLDQLDAVWDQASAQVESQRNALNAITNAEVLVALDPAMAQKTGADTFLIANGAHEPKGSTTKTDGNIQISPVVKEEKITWHTKPKEITPVMYVDLYGRKKAGMDVLEAAAARRGEETLVCFNGQGAHKSRRYGLSERLSRNEQVTLAQLGAKVFDASFKEITPKLPKSHAALNSDMK